MLMKYALLGMMYGPGSTPGLFLFVSGVFLAGKVGGKT
jgi:hypothetical protein